MKAEVEGRLQQLTALDAARAELLSVVTHELRRPCRSSASTSTSSASAAAGAPASPAHEGATDPVDWRDAALDQRRGSTGSSIDPRPSVRGEGLTGLSRPPFDAVAAVGDTVDTLRPPPSSAPDPLAQAGGNGRHRRRHALPAGARAAPRERVEYAPTADG